MKVVIPGGTGQVGMVLKRWFEAKGHNVILLSRGDSPSSANIVHWDGKTKGDWFNEIDGCDVVINLAGRSVNCRYTQDNLKQMLDSRVDSTRIVGEAIAASEEPPKIWLQMSTATIYAHTFGPAHTEAEGVLGGSEPGVPAYWKRSIDIATAWESALEQAQTPQTRKVALRTAMVMSPDRDGILDVISGLVRLGLGGTIGGGRQWVSWIHAEDLCRAIEFLIEQEHLNGAVNLCAPHPVPQREQMSTMRELMKVRIGLPATALMARVGAVFMRTDTELVLKSRRVYPGRLVDSGFTFQHPTWRAAMTNLIPKLAP